MNNLSIITINLNNAAGLSRTLASVCNQKNTEFEYIVIDGGSTDNSLDVINQFHEKINRLVSEPDSGIYNAMNKGIALSTGKYLLFLNSGDELIHENILAKINPADFTADLITFNLAVASPGSEVLKVYPDFPSFKYFLNDSLPHPATFISRQLFQLTNGYDEQYKICSDWQFFLLVLCRYNIKYQHVNITLSRFYLGGISNPLENGLLMEEEKKRILRTHFPGFEDLISEWEEGKRLRYIFHNSRLIKIARALGFLKHPR